MLVLKHRGGDMLIDSTRDCWRDRCHLLVLLLSLDSNAF